MRRLYFRIYLHFVAIIVVFGVVLAIGWMLRPHDDEPPHQFDTVARLVARALPEDPAELDATLRQLSVDFGVRLALYRDDRGLIASAGSPVPPPPEPGHTSGEWRRGDGGPVFVLRLPDGRWLSARTHQHRPGRLLGLLVVLAVVVAIGAWPLARRITRRLERLQTRVDALGAGDLGARVDVEGSDEVAALAKSFNRAAARIESLVSVQRTMLASASHELRTPLARMRVAIELFSTAPRPELRERIERDIAELDTLIDELLLASRLETVHDMRAAEPVDLLALAAEEGARVEAVVTGDPTTVDGDPRPAPPPRAQSLRERPSPRGGDGHRRVREQGRGRRSAPGPRSRPGHPRERARTHLRSVLPRRHGTRDGNGGRSRPASGEDDCRAARGDGRISTERARRVVLPDTLPAGCPDSSSA